MYSNKVIGIFVSPKHLPQLALYNEECETGNNKNFVSTTNGRIVYTYGDILPFSKENIEIYKGIENFRNKDEDMLLDLDERNVYDHLMNDYKKNYPHLNKYQTINPIQFIKNEEFKNTYKSLSDFILECKENKSLRSNEEILDLKNKLLEKYSEFKISPYVKDPRQNYLENTYGKRYMIENENINIFNFIDELVLRGNSKEYYEKVFSGLIYDESYGKKVIDIDSFLEYSNSIDGLLESIEQACQIDNNNDLKIEDR